MNLINKGSSYISLEMHKTLQAIYKENRSWFEPRNTLGDEPDYVGIVFDEFFKQYNATISPKVDWKWLVGIDTLDFSGSVNLHDDKQYCYKAGARKAIMVVLDVKILNDCRGSSQLEYPNFLCSTKKGEMQVNTLRKRSLCVFDPRRIHGLLSSHRIKMIVFWLK